MSSDDDEHGRLEWIGIRRTRREPLDVVESAILEAGRGIVGDHFRPKRSAKREVTLIQHKNLAEIGVRLGGLPVSPELLRRNLVVSGIDLASLIGRAFRIGPVVLQGTGQCSPCSRMDEALGAGGRQAMSRRGGITAIVVCGGTIQCGDRVESLDAAHETKMAAPKNSKE